MEAIANLTTYMPAEEIDRLEKVARPVAGLN